MRLLAHGEEEFDQRRRCFSRAGLETSAAEESRTPRPYMAGYFLGMPCASSAKVFGCTAPDPGKLAAKQRGARVTPCFDQSDKEFARSMDLSQDLPTPVYVVR